MSGLLAQGEAMLRSVVTTTLRVKFTDALRCFEAAGDMFKSLGKWRNAGDAYSQCASCEQTMREPLGAASYFIDAAECMRKVDPLEAIRLYGKAIAEYAVLGRFHVAAALQRTVAELYEADDAFFDAAVAHGYAADYYQGENIAGPALASLVRSAELLILEERYEMASQALIRAIRLCLDDNLLKFNSSALALDVVLCFLCLRDDERALDFIEEHTELDFVFAVSRERRFVLDLILNCQERDKHAFIDHAWNYDYVFELKPYQLHMLHEMFQAIQEPVPEGDGDETESTDSWQGDEEEGEAAAEVVEEGRGSTGARRSSRQSGGRRASRRESRRSSRRSESDRLSSTMGSSSIS
jgi:tetratricopeptide (TPR) repeat protein